MAVRAVSSPGAGTAPDDAPASFRWRSVAVAAFLPTLVFSMGEGALIPVIPGLADNLGASLAVAGFVAALLMLGELVGDLPSGWVVSRTGERTAMLGGALVSLVGVVLAILSRSTWMLGLGVFLIGGASAVFALARHTFMTTYVPVQVRARALSLLGGVFRAGYFVGPLLATALLRLTGSTRSVFWVDVAACLVVIAVLLALPDPERVFRAAAAPQTAAAPPADRDPVPEPGRQGVLATLRRFGAVYLRVGTGAALIMALRASRVAILPLWALSLGMHNADATLVIGVANGLDFGLFYVSGLVMDRWGRLWAAVPAMIGLGAGHLVLAFVHDAPGAVDWFATVAILLGVANGLSSGVNMTLGADLAPRADPAPFLGGWRFITDAGSAASPMLISGLTSLLSLPAAAAVMGVLGLCGAFLLARHVPRYVPRGRVAERASH